MGQFPAERPGGLRTKPTRVPRIVVLDDDPLLLRIVEQRLAEAGFEVATYGEPTGRLTFIARQEPDLVLLDVNMPFLSGGEVLRLMKDNARLRDVPVVLFSATDESALRRLALEAGADGYISKADVGSDFGSRVGRFLEGRAGLFLEAWREPGSSVDLRS